MANNGGGGSNSNVTHSVVIEQRASPKRHTYARKHTQDQPLCARSPPPSDTTEHHGTALVKVALTITLGHD